MIAVSRLLCGALQASDVLRFGHGRVRSPSERRPIVVWNCTARCPLDCAHCYADARAREGARQLSTTQGKKLIDDLAAFSIPVLLFSGGEPLTRPDLEELASYAVERGLKAVLSTSGMGLTPERAKRLGQAGLSYVGISLDGLEATHDRFRGFSGAFKQAMSAVRASVESGLRVGLRCTLNRHNLSEATALGDIAATESVARICYYHVVESGRAAASGLMAKPEAVRAAVRQIFEWTEETHRRGRPVEVLTVDNHCDAAHLLMHAQSHPKRQEIESLLLAAGGNQSGIAIAAINWDGEVYTDQFWRQHPVGNVVEHSFGDIWTNTTQPLLAALRGDRRDRIHGRCKTCKFFAICNGNLRARAEALTGDPWASDPGCYLTDQEIAG